MSIFGRGKTTYDATVEYLTAKGWKYHVLEAGTVLRTGLSGENATFQQLLLCENRQGRLVIYGLIDQKVPETKRQQVAELITRLNYGLVMGNWELDFSNGDLRFRTVLCTQGVPPTQGMIEAIHLVNALILDRHYPAIMSVLYGGTSPSTAAANASHSARLPVDLGKAATAQLPVIWPPRTEETKEGGGGL